MKKNNILIIFAIVVALVVGVIFYLKGSKISSLQSVSQSNNTIVDGREPAKIFKSKTLKMNVLVLPGYEIEEQTTFVNLISSKGKINISRIATNFSDITGYLKDFDSKRKLTVSLESNGRIADFDYVSRVEDFDGGPVSKQKAYFIYVDDGWVYSFSTSTGALFSDLDQIAQSFRYTP